VGYYQEPFERQTQAKLVIGQDVFSTVAATARWENVVDRIVATTRERYSVIGRERSLFSAI